MSVDLGSTREHQYTEVRVKRGYGCTNCGRKSSPTYWSGPGGVICDTCMRMYVGGGSWECDKGSSDSSSGSDSGAGGWGVILLIIGSIGYGIYRSASKFWIANIAGTIWAPIILGVSAIVLLVSIVKIARAYFGVRKKDVPGLIFLIVGGSIGLYLWISGEIEESRKEKAAIEAKSDK